MNDLLCHLNHHNSRNPACSTTFAVEAVTASFSLDCLGQCKTVVKPFDRSSDYDRFKVIELS